MSIFKRLGGKDQKALPIDDKSDELPERALADIDHEDIARSIRAELEFDEDDLEDIVETAKLPPETLHDELDLSEASILADDFDPDEWVSPYVDARGVEPVAREDIEPKQAPKASFLEDIEDLQREIENTVEEQGSSPIRSQLAPEDDALTLGDIDIDEDPNTNIRSQGMNLGELRLDIVRITSDIESGEALYRRAQQRVDSLIGFIEQAEVAVSVLNKMEPENRRLKAANRGLETDVEAQRYKLARLEADLEDQRALASGALVKVETLRSKLAHMNETLADSHREAETLIASNDELKIQAERIKTSLDIETRENITLREKMEELSAYAEGLTDSKIDLQKSAEASARELDIVSDHNNSLETENAEMRLRLRNAERQNAVMKDELVEIQDKIISFKTQHETHLHRRDDKIAALAARNVELEKTLKHKENIIQSTILDVAQLRKSNTRHDIDREKLEKTLASQNFQLNKAEEQLLLSKQQMSSLDQRYKDVAEALMMKRRRTASTPHASPDIHPRPAPTPVSERLSVDEWSERHSNPFLTEDSA